MQVQTHSKIYQGWFLRKSLYVARCLHPMQIPFKEQWLQGVLFHFKVMTVYIISHCFNETPKLGKNFSFPFMKKHWELWCWGKCKTNNKYIWSQGQGHHCPPQGDLGDSHAYERTRWKPWIPDTPWCTPWYLNFPWPKKKRKNVLLLILMQSTCKYYSKGKVKMVVILPEVLVVQMLKSKWIDICIVIIAVITTVAIFVCLCVYFPVCSMPEYSAGREQKKVMDFLERDWLAVVSHWIWVLRTKPGS